MHGLVGDDLAVPGRADKALSLSEQQVGDLQERGLSSFGETQHSYVLVTKAMSQPGLHVSKPCLSMLSWSAVLMINLPNISFKDNQIKK